ncbi:hypothetical protein L3Y34_000650 [Caenorhabditis briggsae]|uniref:DUF7627 domain-containing protein n=1 Tax=Caenorhabditis briggsae TaxID=6238 RepID=A0AAE9D9U2_CAEBR|nr:hypothetical protein L3Y34_000650 [Caenorhabditis briggsae]
MSRLTGRVSFQGQENCYSSLNYRRMDNQDVRRGNGNNYRQPFRSEDNEERSKPRGKGAVRYQGTYSDRFHRQDQNKVCFSSDQNERIGMKGSDRCTGPSQSQDKPITRKPTQRIEDVIPPEELLEVEDLIEQISDLSIRSDRSASQIKRNILASDLLLDTMDIDDWEKVCKSMIETALDKGETEFIADLMVVLLKNPIFAAVMSDELMDASSKHIMEKDGKSIPSFLSSILCAHWPRQYFKAFDNVNPILYTVVCIVKGWILVVQEDTQRYYSKPGESKNTPEIIETPEMVNLCAVALSDLCESAQRQLWINWASLTDEIYECIKPSITHNPNLTGDSKERLLETLLQMTQWTKNRQASMKSSGVQTVSCGC